MAEISSEWVSELKKGSVQLCLLALISREKKYGFQIIKELSQLSDGFFDLKEGTLYPALRRMEKKGFVESEWIAKNAGVPRKYYKITKKGRTVLEEAEEVWKRLRGSIDTVLGRGAP